MNHLVWRLHRNQAYFAIGALAVLTVILLITGITMADDYRTASPIARPLRTAATSAASCSGATERSWTWSTSPWWSPSCSVSSGERAPGQGVRGRHPQPRLDPRSVPLALDTCQHRLVPPRRSRMGRRPRRTRQRRRYPENALNSRFDVLDVQGIVPVAYALRRRTRDRRRLGYPPLLPSLAATLAIFVAIRVAIGIYLRPHYMAPVTKVFGLLGRHAAPAVPGSCRRGWSARPGNRSAPASSSRSTPPCARPPRPGARASSASAWRRTASTR